MPLESFYLCAINLHGQRPPSISASKVAHVTVNRNLLRTKLQRVHLAFGRTTKMKIVTVRFIDLFHQRSFLHFWTTLVLSWLCVKILKINVSKLVSKKKRIVSLGDDCLFVSTYLNLV